MIHQISSRFSVGDAVRTKPSVRGVKHGRVRFIHVKIFGELKWTVVYTVAVRETNRDSLIEEGFLELDEAPAYGTTEPTRTMKEVRP